MKSKYLSILLILVLLLTSCAPSFEAQINKGSDLVLEGKLREAEEFFFELLEKNVGESEIYLKLSEIYMEKEDLPKAINILNKGLLAAENKDSINLSLSRIYLSLSDMDNAKKHLMLVEEKSGQLALALIKLASDSNDLELLDQTFNEYKEMEVIKEDNVFFENALLAYSKVHKSEEIESIANRALDLNLKLDPAVILNCYNTLIALEMPDLAESILEKDLYNKEIVDLSIIPKIIKEDNNKQFINLTSGYFVDQNRLDIALLYGIDYDGYYPNLEITLVNGINGDIISNLKEETINAYMNIDTFDTNGDKDHVLCLWGHAGGTGTPSSVDLYRFKGNNFEKINFIEETDREIVFKDQFEYEVKSKNLDINYVLQLDLENIPYYISQNIYDKEGKLLASQEDLGTGYEHMDTVSNLSGGDYIVYSLELLDTYDNRSYLGYVNSYFKVKDNKLTLVNLAVEDGQGKTLPLNYKEVEGYVEVDFTQFIPKLDDLTDTLSFYLNLFKETESSLKSNYGPPLLEDYYEVKYLKYDKFLAFVDVVNPNERLYSVWTNDLLGLESSEDFIIQKFGAPESMGYDEEMGNFIIYSIDNYVVTFIDVGYKNPYIRIKRIT